MTRHVALVFALFLIGVAPCAVAQGTPNVGYPVRCYPNGDGSAVGSVPTGEFKYFTCLRVGGGFPNFTADGRVPEGHYLLVTDIDITPQAGSDTDGRISVRLYASYGESSRSYSIRMRSSGVDTWSRQYRVPALILGEGFRIEAYNEGTHWVDPVLTGLLVTRLEFLLFFDGFEIPTG